MSAPIVADLEGASDEGFTLVEVLITLLVTGILFTIIFGLITDLFHETQTQTRTTAAMQQEEIAGQWFLQYLHGAVRVLPGSNATTLVAEIEDGTVQSGANAGATQYATFDATLTPDGSHNGQFTMTVTPTSGTPVSVTAQYAENVSSVFTYYYSGSGASTVSSTTTPTASELDEIVGVAINLPFSDRLDGLQAITPTQVATLQTTVYLENSSSAPGTTVALASSPSSPRHGSVVNVTATVTATGTTSSLSDGTVSFVITLGGSTVPTSCSSESLSSGSGSGTATCSFTPPSSGTYSVTATFNGSANAAASSSAAYPLAVS